MKTAYRTVSALRASAGPFIGIPMHAPTSPEYSQVFDLVYLITDFPLSPHFAHSRIPSARTSHDFLKTSFFLDPLGILC